jgi:hypothetical protein
LNYKEFTISTSLQLATLISQSSIPIDEKEAKIFVQIMLSSHILTDLSDPQASGTQDRFRHAIAGSQFERPTHRY